MIGCRCPGALFLILLAQAAACQAAGAQTALARNGRAMQPIVVSSTADAGVKALAHELADYLGRITGATFDVQEGDGRTGIALGTVDDFPALQANADLQLDRLVGSDLATKQSYILRSHPGGVQIIGATRLAADYAMWDLLHRVGYRQFFPGPTWEIVPREPNLAIAVNAFEKPDYFDRRVWYGFGGNFDPKHAWDRRNRVTMHGYKHPDGMRYAIENAHVYGGVIQRFRDEFTAHPEYRGLVDGERKGSLCLSNPGVRELLRRYADEWFTRHPERVSISMEPNDGGKWCECEPCKAMGVPSTRVVVVANEIAELVNEKFGDKYVGVLAYYQHAMPPGVTIHPKVVVCVATHLNQGHPTPENLDAWRAQGGVMGVYDYWGVFQWHCAMPAKSLGGSLPYLRESIRDYHRRGARVFVAESGENWGASGLGYYVASRILWDVDESDRVEAIVEDFLDKAFGPAKEPMRRFYEVVDGSQSKRGTAEFFHDRAAHMYRALAEAQRLGGGDDAVRKRIDELILYTRYVELFADRAAVIKSEDAELRQAAVTRLTAHAYRMRHTNLAHWSGFRSIIGNESLILTKEELRSSDVPAALQPPSEAEIVEILEAGLRRYAGESPDA